jgi:hypothetical protein
VQAPDSRLDLLSAGDAAANELNIRDHRPYPGYRRGIPARQLQLLIRPNLPFEMNHTTIDCNSDVLCIEVRIRAQRGLYLCRNGSVGGELGLTSGRRRRARDDAAYSQRRQCLQPTSCMFHESPCRHSNRQCAAPLSFTGGSCDIISRAESLPCSLHRTEPHPSQADARVHSTQASDAVGYLLQTARDCAMRQRVATSCCSRVNCQA